MAGSAAVARSGRWNVGLVAASDRIGNREANLWVARSKHAADLAKQV